MTEFYASAPGKLVVCGEYAVLAGAAAICAAIDRRALVTVREADGNRHVVRAPGFSSIDGEFRAQSGEFTWLQGGEHFDLFEQVWHSSSPDPDGPLEFGLDTTAFRETNGGSKIGVGSSAALAVAIATALEAIGGGVAVSAAGRAHLEFQAGLGSGVDIACSHEGGIIEYRREGPLVHAMEWPESLQFAVLWSGVPADTRAKVRRLGNRIDTDFVDSADRCARIMREGDAAQSLDALRDYTAALREFDQSRDLGIFAAGHAALADSAAEHDVVYKPCGAGGGDVGLAVAVSAESLASFCETASGFERLDMKFDPTGARLDSKP